MAELVKWEQAKSAIAEAKSVDELKLIRNKAEAWRYAAKQAKESLEVQNDIAEIKIRAERRCGEFLKEMPKQHGARPADTESQDVTPQTLSNLGITKNDSSKWQLIADIPEDKFETHIEQTKKKKKELTTSGTLKIAKKEKQERAVENIKSKSINYKNKDKIILFEGDLFDVIDKIENESIDLLCTDPPYFILNNEWDQFDNKNDYLEFTENWLNVVIPKIKGTGRIYISFSQWYQYDFYEILKRNKFFGFIFKQNIIWYYKNNNQPSNKKEYRYNYEPLFYLYGKEAGVLNFTNDTFNEMQQNVWEIAIPQSNFKEGKFHLAQKPLELYRRIMKTGSKENDLVLDCFAGSGTTGIICKELNRKCILIEKDQGNIKIIKGRLCG